ncbi:MAG: arginase [Flavobacteriaceae bacterium]|nr:arginase [Flavobacteriaceae bacterium]
MKRIKLIKNRSDIGAGTRGSDMGIDAIEIAAINKNSNYFDRFDFVDVETENESIYNKVNNSFAKRIKYVYEQCDRLANSVCECLQSQSFPLILSGDHSSALGTISGIKAAYPNKELGVIWIDAHADLHSPYTSPSGNIHGMPLAAALNVDNQKAKINEVSGETFDYWNKMKNIGANGSKIQSEHLVYFGVRDTEEPEENQMAALGLKNYTVSEMRYRGFDVCLEEALHKLEACDMIYISFDVDSMDCDMISYGTGTPVAKGFDVEEIKMIFDVLLQSRKTACIEFVEVNPLLDLKGNVMAETAFDILDTVTKGLEKYL